MIAINPPPFAGRPDEISPGEIERAIHLDFEGFKDAPPVMASVLVDGRTDTVVFEDIAPELAEAARATDLRTTTLDSWVRELFERSVRESRWIAAFSSRERLVLEECGLDPDEIGERHLDVRPLGLAWRKRHHPEVDRAVKARRRRRRERGEFDAGRENSLSSLASLAGIEPPPMYGAGRVTARLRAVIGQIADRGSYEAITPIAKSKWRNLLTHNRWDCDASRRLASVAVEGGPTPPLR